MGEAEGQGSWEARRLGGFKAVKSATPKF